MSDQKEVRRYYDFSSLLSPAPHLQQLETKLILMSLGDVGMHKLVTQTATNSLAICSDIAYGKSRYLKFVGTEKEIDWSIREFSKLRSPDALAEAVRANFILQPGSQTIYTHLFNFEIDMIKRKVKSEPLKIKSN